MSIDTVNDLPPIAQYTAGVGQTVFPYPFPIFVNADLRVHVDGVLKVLTTDYTVSGATNPTGGNVTFLVAPGSGKVVTIYRDIAIQRLSDFQQNGPLASVTVNDELDRMTLVDQQLESALTRTVRVDVADAGSTSFNPLPVKATRAGKFIAFDGDGQPIASVGTGNDAALRTDLAVTTVGTEGGLLVGVRRPEAGSVARTVQAKSLELFTSADFDVAMSSSTGAATDETAELTSAANAAIANLADSILRILGGFAKTTGLTFTSGVSVVGSPGSSHYSFGNLIYNGNGTDNLLNWNASVGSGGPNRIENLQLAATAAVGGTTTTGAAIRLFATSQVQRPGEVEIDRVLVDGLADGFGRGLYIDGSAATLAGSTGIRSIRLADFRVAGCSINNEYARFHWVSHMTGGRLQIDQGGGTGTPGIRFTGTSFNVVISELICNGNVLIEDAMTDWHCSGLIGINFTIGASVNRLTFIGHVAGNVDIAAGASRVHLFGSVGGNVTIGVGATGCIIGQIGGTITNNAPGTFVVIDTDTERAEGSFTATLTGCTTSPTGTIFWKRVGDLITLHIPTVTATSNTTACTLTGMPAELNPEREANIRGQSVSDNSVVVLGAVSIQTDGVIRLNVGANASVFQNVGTKGSQICQVNYSLKV